MQLVNKDVIVIFKGGVVRGEVVHTIILFYVLFRKVLSV